MSSVVQRSVDPATKTVWENIVSNSAKETIATTADVTLATLLRTLNKNLKTGKTHIVT